MAATYLLHHHGHFAAVTDKPRRPRTLKASGASQAASVSFNAIDKAMAESTSSPHSHNGMLAALEKASATAQHSWFKSELPHIRGIFHQGKGPSYSSIVF